MELVWIAHGSADLADGNICGGQQPGSFFHAILRQKFLMRLLHGIPENLSEIAAVQVAASCQIGYRNFPHIIIFNKRKSFTDIEIG